MIVIGDGGTRRQPKTAMKNVCVCACVCMELLGVLYAVETKLRELHLLKDSSSLFERYCNTPLQCLALKAYSNMCCSLWII